MTEGEKEIVKACYWKRNLIQQCKDVDTYQESFMGAISTLAALLERRDEAYAEFVADGCRTMVERVSDRGAVNQVVNPLLKLWQELNRDALAYWRDLGLTPAGYKRLNLEAAQAKSNDGLEKILSQLMVDSG